jgi:hypothetical protein
MSGGAAKSDGGLIDDAPAGLVDLDRSPFGVSEIEIESSVELADPDKHVPDRGVVLRPRLDDANRRREHFRIWHPPGFLEETPSQPAAKTARFDRPRLAMSIDLNVGVGGFVGRLKEFGRLRHRDHDVGLVRGTAARFAALFGD